MIIRRIAEAIRAQNWFTVIIEILIVVIGIVIGMQVTQWNEDRVRAERTKLITQTLREDMQTSSAYESTFILQLTNGVNAWRAAFARGERPPPYYFRVPGSDTGPANVWDALLNMKLGELLHPKLVFELAFYYSEIAGVGRKYIRYVTFLEENILPRLKEDPSVFYTIDGSRLKPEYEVYMDNLLLWASEMKTNVAWSKCLAIKLESPTEAGESCLPALRFDDSDQTVFKNKENP